MSQSSVETIDIREKRPQFDLFSSADIPDQLDTPEPPVRLVPVHADHPELDVFMSDPLTACRWATRTHEVEERVIVRDTSTGRAVAALAITDVQLRHGHARVLLAALSDDESVRRALQGLFAYLDRLFEAYPFRKLYAELVDDELAEVGSGLGRYLEHEGTFRRHLFWAGSHLDVHTVAVMRDRWEEHQKDDTLDRILDLAAASDGILSHAPHARASQLASDLAVLSPASAPTPKVGEVEVPSQLELERDLGLDALALAELDLAIRRFGLPNPNRPLRTVADVILAVTSPDATPLFSPC